MSESAAEVTFLDEEGVKVTSVRFIVPSQTFVMSGVTAVKAHHDKPSRVLPSILLLLGLLPAFGGFEPFAVFGLPLMLLGALLWAIKKDKYVVVLSTASGEAKALEGRDQAWINRITDALTQSIIHRG